MWHPIDSLLPRCPFHYLYKTVYKRVQDSLFYSPSFTHQLFIECCLTPAKGLDLARHTAVSRRDMRLLWGARSLVWDPDIKQIITQVLHITMRRVSSLRGGYGEVVGYKMYYRGMSSGFDVREAFPREDGLSWEMSADRKLTRPRGLWEKNVSGRENRALKWCVNGTFQWRHRQPELEEKPALEMSVEGHRPCQC